ncbi:MAG: hypothetical protein ABI914_02215 [Acidobacteriota bacterium]
MKPVLRVALLLLAVVLLISLFPAVADACPLCRDAKADTDYAGGTASLPNGFYYSILFMVCAPFAVIGAFITRVVLARRRLQREEVAAAAGPPAPDFVAGPAGSRP